MQHAALAQRFDEIGRGLEADGHRIIVRKTRALIEAGDLDGALRFLEEAGRRLPGDPLGGLAEAVTRWREAGGDVDALAGEAGWQAAKAREGQLSGLIASAVSSDEDAISLDALTSRLAEQSKALADAEPLPALDIPVVEPPAPVAAAADAARAVEEAPSQLEARPMDLEDRPAADAPTVEETPAIDPPAADEPVAAAPADEPVEAPAADEPAVDTPVAEDAPADEPVEAAPAAEDAPVEDAPVEDAPIDVPPVVEATPAESEGSSGMVIMLLLLAAALIAGWFLTR